MVAIFQHLLIVASHPAVGELFILGALGHKVYITVVDCRKRLFNSSEWSRVVTNHWSLMTLSRRMEHMSLLAVASVTDCPIIRR